MAAPRLSYLCTLQVARRVWPELPSKGLAALAGHLGIEFRHHNAAEDARACAEVALAAARAIGALEVADIRHRLEVWQGTHMATKNPQGWTGPEASPISPFLA